MIHQSHPLDYIAYDRTMQDIVYKVILYYTLYYIVLKCILVSTRPRAGRI